MQLTRRTADSLTIEEGVGTSRLIGWLAVVIGVAGTVIGWTNGSAVLLIVPPIFLLFGLKVLLFGRTTTHHFERARRVVVMESKGRWSVRRRELPFKDIDDVLLEEIHKAGSAPSCYVYFLTKQGERIRWADSYDGSHENTLACVDAAREWLGMERNSRPPLSLPAQELEPPRD